MSNIFRKVVAAVIKNSPSNLTDKSCSIDFLQNPTLAPKSAERHNASRLDGYMLVKGRLQAETLSWADVVLSCEYKRQEGDEDLDDVTMHLGLFRYRETFTANFRTCGSVYGGCNTSCGTIRVAVPLLA